MLDVLVSAYACEPNRGSEGEIGWSLVHELATSHRVWVITRANNRAVHDEFFSLHPKPDNLEFLYFDLPRQLSWYKKGRRYFLVYYYLWQVGSYFKAKKFLRNKSVHLAHHLTGGMDWMPSGLAALGLPFVWGPVGSEQVPSRILSELPFETGLKERLRIVLRYLLRNVDPLVRLTGAKADVILSHTPENLPRRYGKKVLPYVQTGINSDARFAQQKTELARQSEFTVVFAGEFVHWKGAAYALEAFLRFAADRDRIKLVMIGDGPLRSTLEERAARFSTRGLVDFRGRLSMLSLTEELAKGDVFLYPSYHHGLATVVLQAMLTGLPVVCIAGDAIGRAVSDQCGITVPLLVNDDYIQGLADSLSRLYSDEGLRVRLARNARQLALSRYSYRNIAAGYSDVYRRAIHNRMI